MFKTRPEAQAEDGNRQGRRLIIVSNRLPFTIKHDNDTVTFGESAGGVATGLHSYVESLNSAESPFTGYVWVGWPGSTIPANLHDEVRTKSMAEYRSFPVFLSEQDLENFYQGFCNKTIWPLFHYFPGFAKYVHEYWEQYRAVNQAFCDTLSELITPGDILWIHDYHLMLLPELVRSRFPKTPVGFFLHIPFPTFEVFRLLPRTWRSAILEGLLGADLIGFHTYDYMQDFLRCVHRILGHEHNMGQLVVQNRIVKAGTYPMGIDFAKFRTAAVSNSDVQREKEELLRSLRDMKVVLSIDRLDYSKGILNRLEGFLMLLESKPEWRTKVTLVAVVVPSRIGVDDYERMKRQIEELVGKINGRFGTVHWTPVIYQFKAVSFAPLVALYLVGDIALVTPLRDGMNLIAKEYIASRADETGVLVLSEMAGAVKELGEAVIINPNNREEIADALSEALEMPTDEQIRRNHVMQNRLRRYTVSRWASEFTAEILSTQSLGERFRATFMSEPVREQIVKQYEGGSRRLLLLDYDGTLVPFARRPALARPGEPLLKTLSTLTDSPHNEVLLISGRSRNDMENWFGALRLGLVAEHGAWLRETDGAWKMLKALNNDWKPKIQPILEMYADRVPGAYVEEKDYSLVWHYRAADPELGEHAAREMTDDLLIFTANIDIQVLQGKRIVEIRNAGINKGIAAMHWVSAGTYDFIMAVGDDWTDEDLFTALPPTSITIKVGASRTQARFHIRDVKEVLQLIASLSRKDQVAV